MLRTGQLCSRTAVRAQLMRNCVLVLLAGSVRIVGSWSAPLSALHNHESRSHFRSRSPGLESVPDYSSGSAANPVLLPPQLPDVVESSRVLPERAARFPDGLLFRARAPFASLEPRSRWIQQRHPAPAAMPGIERSGPDFQSHKGAWTWLAQASVALILTILPALLLGRIRAEPC